MNYTRYLVTITAFNKKRKVLEHELNSALHTLLQLLPLRVINYGLENSGRYSQNHLHLVLQQTIPYFRYKGHNKIGPFQIDWKYLRTDQDIHRAQVYVAKEQYQYIEL